MRDLAKKRIHDVARRRLHREKIRDIKLIRGCMDCGYRECAAALEFDHRDSSIKKFGIAVSSSCSWALILEEIAKCDVVCANCHRVRTVNRRAQRLGGSPPPAELAEN